ncbi:MAG: peptidylprolyl isomerase [Nevskiaceae bacterium]|jgi:peptidyl-prolyl cis-trans isomerase A (cyclophilin A)|nr:peptidylprolyl isomerase [Nevskiaceae bacterium]
MSRGIKQWAGARAVSALLIALAWMASPGFAGEDAQTDAAVGVEAASVEAAPGAEPTGTFETTRVLVHTDLGDIGIELQTQRAPITAGNFLRYVDDKRFDGSTIYRAVTIGDEGKFGLVQGGLAGNRDKVLPPIAHESPADTGLHSVDGAVSMARLDPGTATADFFFIVGGLLSMDGDPATGDPGYAVFGNVFSGMDLVRTILLLPRKQEAQSEAMKGQMLQQPVKIISVRRVE